MEIEDLFKWLGAEERNKYLVLGSWIAGSLLVILNFIFLRDMGGYEEYFTTLNLVGAAVALLPSVIVKYRVYRRKKEIERRFPDFLRDVTEGAQAGMTLPSAIKNVSEGEYGALTPHARKMAAQIDWGVPLEEVLERFADRVGSDVLRRTVSTIIETHRSGGNVSEVLKDVGDTVIQIERIKEERKSHVYSQMLTGYTIYFVFLGVMIGLQKFLIPSLAVEGGAKMGLGGGGMKMGGLVAMYKQIFQNLVLIQGFFSGIAIGKMSEGSVLAGLRHVVVLIAIGYTAFFVLL